MVLSKWIINWFLNTDGQTFISPFVKLFILDTFLSFGHHGLFSPHPDRYSHTQNLHSSFCKSVHFWHFLDIWPPGPFWRRCFCSGHMSGPAVAKSSFLQFWKISWSQNHHFYNSGKPFADFQFWLEFDPTEISILKKIDPNYARFNFSKNQKY